MIVVRLLIIWVIVGVVVVAGISATHPTLQFNGPGQAAKAVMFWPITVYAVIAGDLVRNPVD